MRGRLIDKEFRILFACVGNSSRSQMAQGFAKAYGGDRVEVRSAGSRPVGHVLPEAVQVMQELGIDISHHSSDGFDEPWIRECDLVVTMGCGDDACPAFIGKPLQDWQLEDPAGKDLETVRKVRDEIRKRVEALLRENGIVMKEEEAGRDAAPGSRRGVGR